MPRNFEEYTQQRGYTLECSDEIFESLWAEYLEMHFDKE